MIFFKEHLEGLSSGNTFEAFFVGYRFDLRLSAFLVLFFTLWVLFSPSEKHFWKLFIVFFILNIFYILDFANYSYLSQKLTFEITGFLSNPKESFGMIWKTYPVFGLAILSTVLSWLAAKFLEKSLIPQKLFHIGLKRGAVQFIILLLFAAPFVYGKFSRFPLRWSDAYFSQHPFSSAIALNPVLNFFDTFAIRQQKIPREEAKENYPIIKKFLDLPDDSKFPNYEQNIAGDKHRKKMPDHANVVIVLLESFSGYKSSLYSNPLETTPFLNEIAEKSVFWKSFYTAHPATARGVFATLSSLPDTVIKSNASRDPRAVNQRLVINEFKNHEKLYLIGGSASWANVRGFLKSSIEGLKIYEEENFESPHNDIWGISDKNLFLEANDIFKKQKKPFFSVIQTAGNHRPYTIPKEDQDEFKIRNYNAEELRKGGFQSEKEVNAFRYMDYSVQKFFEAASREKYFEDTLFVFLGDHGIPGLTGSNVPTSWSDLGITIVHTPLLFYAPKYLKPKTIESPAQQMDVMPTIAGLFGLTYTKYSLGRDLLDPKFDDSRIAFQIYHAETPKLSLIEKDKVFQVYADGTSPMLYSLNILNSLKSPLQNEKLEERVKLAQALYYSSQYLIYRDVDLQRLETESKTKTDLSGNKIE